MPLPQPKSIFLEPDCLIVICESLFSLYSWIEKQKWCLMKHCTYYTPNDTHIRVNTLQITLWTFNTDHQTATSNITESQKMSCCTPNHTHCSVNSVRCRVHIWRCGIARASCSIWQVGKPRNGLLKLFWICLHHASPPNIQQTWMLTHRFHRFPLSEEFKNATQDKCK